MKRRLYYIVYKETEDIGGFEECTGIKTVYVYTIENNEPKVWFDIEAYNEESSEEKINEWLIDNGYGDEEFEMILL